MRLSSWFAIPALLMALAAPAARPAPPGAAAVSWRPWSPAAFDQARAQGKPVFLYLEAVWCHWCHVMQKTTLRDPDVVRLLADRFVTIKADHDAEPMLAGRYRDWGWPALVFYAPDGTEIVKRRGHIEPADFARLLRAIVADPTPEEAALPDETTAVSADLPAPLRAQLLEFHARDQDERLGGLDTMQKFIDRDSVEYSLLHADDPRERTYAARTLEAARALLDPVWGGAYQYSTHGDWRHPHYEKIMRVQAGYLRVYSLGCAVLKRKADCASARRLRDYLMNFLRQPDGSFAASQDSDLVQGRKAHDYFALGDEARRARGMPRIDTQAYTANAGLAAEALARWHAVSPDREALEAAIAAANWAQRERALPGGGYRHAAQDSGGPYLADTLAMANAQLALFEVTGDAAWRARARASASFIEARFLDSAAGYRSAVRGAGPVPPAIVLEENIGVARLAAALHRLTGDPRYGAMTDRSRRWLVARASRVTFEEIGIVLAEDEARAASARP